MGDMGYIYKILVRKPVGKRPCGRPRHRWEDRMDVRENGWGRFGLDA
jgi:hypothetical protein